MAVWFAVEHPDMPAPTVTVVPLEENHGLAHALNVGLEHCLYEYYSRLSLCGSPAHRYRTWLIARTCGQRNMTVSPLIEAVALWNSPLESATSNPSTGCDVAVATASALAESE